MRSALGVFIFWSLFYSTLGSAANENTSACHVPKTGLEQSLHQVFSSSNLEEPKELPSYCKQPIFDLGAISETHLKNLIDVMNNHPVENAPDETSSSGVSLLTKKALDCEKNRKSIEIFTADCTGYFTYRGMQNRFVKALRLQQLKFAFAYELSEIYTVSPQTVEGKNLWDQFQAKWNRFVLNNPDIVLEDRSTDLLEESRGELAQSVKELSQTREEARKIHQSLDDSLGIKNAAILNQVTGYFLLEGLKSPTSEGWASRMLKERNLPITIDNIQAVKSIQSDFLHRGFSEQDDSPKLRTAIQLFIKDMGLDSTGLINDLYSIEGLTDISAQITAMQQVLSSFKKNPKFEPVFRKIEHTFNEAVKDSMKKRSDHMDPKIALHGVAIPYRLLSNPILMASALSSLQPKADPYLVNGLGAYVCQSEFAEITEMNQDTTIADGIVFTFKSWLGAAAAQRVIPKKFLLHTFAKKIATSLEQSFGAAMPIWTAQAVHGALIRTAKQWEAESAKDQGFGSYEEAASLKSLNQQTTLIDASMLFGLDFFLKGKAFLKGKGPIKPKIKPTMPATP